MIVHTPPREGSTKRTPLVKGPGSPPTGITWQVRSLLAQGDASAATQAALTEYGAELFGFLIATVDDHDVARIVYAEVGRRAEAEISGFTWACTLRVWLYSLARSELRERRRRRRGLGASGSALPVVTVPPETVEMSTAVASLRKALPEEDREILILSVDRGFGWPELAWASLGDRASDDALRAEARRLGVRVSELLEQLEAALRRHGRRR